MYTKFWSEGVRGLDHSEDLGADERTTLKQILKKYGVGWIQVAQPMVQRQTHVATELSHAGYHNNTFTLVHCFVRPRSGLFHFFCFTSLWVRPLKDHSGCADMQLQPPQWSLYVLWGSFF
jgi:hypothetical protein